MTLKLRAFAESAGLTVPIRVTDLASLANLAGAISLRNVLRHVVTFEVALLVSNSPLSRWIHDWVRQR